MGQRRYFILSDETTIQAFGHDDYEGKQKVSRSVDTIPTVMYRRGRSMFCGCFSAGGTCAL